MSSLMTPQNYINEKGCFKSEKLNYWAYLVASRKLQNLQSLIRKRQRQGF